MLIKNSLQICDLSRTPICELYDNTPYRVRSITESLKVNEITTLSFELPIENPKWVNIKNEHLVLYNGEYYKIKSPSFNHDTENRLFVHVECKHYSDNLACDLISVEETTPKTVVDLMKIALCYDENGKPTKGWTVGEVTVDRVAKRGLEVMEQSPFSVLLTIAEKYDGILKFNSQTMTVDMLARQSTERPTVDLRVSKNLKSIEINYDTSEMYTRLYCYGSTDEEGNELNIMKVNPTGKAYIDNFDYYYKLGYTKEYVNAHPELFVSTNIWRDDNYYNADDLYEDGVKELAKIAQPVVTVKVTALDMGLVLENNNMIDLSLGDCIRVRDEDLGVDTLCNVISREINYEEPHLLNIEVTNSVVYHDTLSQLFTNVSTSSSIVTSGGNLVGGASTNMNDVKGYLNTYYINTEQIEAKYATIDNLNANYLTAEQIQANYIDATSIGAQYATIGSLNAIEAKIDELNVDEINAKFGDFEELFADNAEFHNLIATEAEIEELKASDVTVTGTLKANNAEIETIKATYVQVGSFEAYKGTVENLFATNAEIENLKAEYVNAKEIETDSAKIEQLEVAIAKIETLQATLANVENLVSKTIITDNLQASKATIDNLETTLATIETAIINIAQIEDLEAANAQIENLNAQYIDAMQIDVDVLNAKSATIEQLNTHVLKSEFGSFEKLTAENFEATNASIGSLDANVANINSVLAGNIGTGLLQTVHLTADNVVIDDAIIKSAMIESINTDEVTIGNEKITLSKSTQQFKDKDGNVRVQIGQDAQGNFNFIVKGEDGTTTIFDENGVTENAVPDGLIVDKMVADDAGIQASKVKYVDKDGDKTLQTVIETEQGRIETLIKETTIENKDGSTTSLKDAYNQTVQTVDGIKTTIANVETDVESMDSRITTVETTADGLKTTVTQANTNATNAMTLAEQNANKFSWLVKSGTSATNFELTDRTATLVANNINLNGLVTFSGLNSATQKQVNNNAIKVSDRNLVLNSNEPKTSTEYKIAQYNLVEDWIVGQEYTFMLKGTLDGGYFGLWRDTGSIGINAQLSYDSTHDIYYHTFACPEPHETQTLHNVLSIYNYPSSATHNSTIEWVKLVKGNKTSWDWSPAPEDKANQSIIDAWTSEAVIEGTTVINGGYIQTNTINTEHLVVDEIFSDGSAVMNIVNAQEIDAKRITSGYILAERLDLYGLSVLQKSTNQETLNISNNGDITLRGTIESYDYVAGESGWHINSNGNVEFNDIIARGSVINNGGGIAKVDLATIVTDVEQNIITPVSNYTINSSVNGGGTVYTTSSILDVNIGDTIKVVLTISGFNPTTQPFSLVLSSGESIVLSYNSSSNNYTGTIVCTKANTLGSTVKLNNLITVSSGAVINSLKVVKATQITETVGDVQPVFWAGASYSERNNAPFIVNNDGSMIATKGTFGGVFTGDIQIGNISFVDPSNTNGYDAVLTIINGNTGTPAVQLTDTDESRFAQNIIIGEQLSENGAFTVYSYIGKKGNAYFNDSVSVGENTLLNSDTLVLGGQELNTNENGFVFKSSQVNIGTVNENTLLNVYGNATIDGQLQLLSTLLFGNMVECKTTTNGLDWNFIN